MSADGTELSEEVRHTQFAEEACVNALEDAVDISLAARVEHVDVVSLTCRVVRVVAEPVRIVAVDRSEQVCWMLVVRALESSKSCCCRASAVWIYHEVTELVVAACRANDVNKVLLEFCDSAICRGIGWIAPVVAIVKNLVECLEEQLVVIVLEAVGVCLSRAER